MTGIDLTEGSRRDYVLSHTTNPRYDRGIINGLSPFIDRRVDEKAGALYSPSEISQLVRLQGTERDVEARMPVKITAHYLEMTQDSPALRTLVKASPDETLNLEGDPDPAGQLSYSPVDGLLHKYEMALLYVVSTCSAHCRFCYREELIARKDVERPDGEVRKKGMAKEAEVSEYITAHNAAVEANYGTHPDTGRPALREVLLSGGDPMVLPNTKLAGWLCSLTDAGVRTIRIGTKELAFHPDRFDDSFMAMLDAFHRAYPDVSVRFMVHFCHPDEFLLKNPDGSYRTDERGAPEWRASTRDAVDRLTDRRWIGVHNQTPIIRGVNDDADSLRVLQREMVAAGIANHYFFCGRDIVAYKAFNVPMERAWELLTESQRGLSGVEAQARLSGSHYLGKIEVVSVSGGAPNGSESDGEHGGFVVFKRLRSPADAAGKGQMTIVRRNPEALWYDDYADRVVVDDIGLFAESDRV